MMTSTRFALLFMAATVALTAPDDLHAQAKKKGKASNPERAPLRREVPDTVKVERDLVYSKTPQRDLMLDLYLPKKPAGEKIPCIVVIHGGGWMSGDKTRFAAISIRLAEQGYAAACIGYRLIPEAPFPACVQDSKAAVRWVRANATKYGLNADQIGAIGGSAGAHLVAMLGTTAGSEKLEGTGGNAGVSSRIQALVAMAPPADLTAMAERRNVDKEVAKLVSPLNHVDKNSAPMLLLHSEQDATVPISQSEQLEKKLKEAKVPVEFVKMGDNHAFWNSPKYFDSVMERSVKFFREHLKVK